ncbi:MAG: UDP-N-acetylglucosamine--N-acetylmuramyl-(pentapeptide) pyrophosphoryl-undecaprenol N-acetylglucosamine transferase [Actinobacteria bacterium]|nr:UDP-N-acetylglucosamine--N-acetylmuramyl-(pentapeptide) pyrophosphoryl-undecaprenol N-acetylglucosamine transferase [Actinomycetota bacterium]
MNTAPAHTAVLIAGGGTSGHVLPALAVARALVDRGLDQREVAFIGASRGIEAELVPAAGFEVTLLPGRGIQRRLTWDNVGAVVGLLRAVGIAVALVRRRRPCAVLAVGGFASAAGSIAALVWRVPLVVADQNARAGAANRLAARWAKACAVAFPGTDLPRSVVTGNPVRPEILAVAAHRDRDGARARLGVPAGRHLLVVFAGSLGATSINRSVWDAALRWSNRSDLAVYHVVGRRDFAAQPPAIRDLVHDSNTTEPSGLWYRAIDYEEHMEVVLDAADLALCRSGGTTVAELAVIGVPAILVPLPIAPRDHQRANAATLVDAGAAVVLDDAAVDADSVVRLVDEWLDDGRLAERAAAARSLGRPDAAAAVAELVEEVAAGGRGR